MSIGTSGLGKEDLVHVWVCRDTLGYIGISGICGEIQKYISYRQYLLPNLTHMSSLLAPMLNCKKVPMSTS